MPKTIAQMKRRLQLALQEADEADAILQLVREAVARYELRPEDVFEQAQLRLAVERLVEESKCATAATGACPGAVRPQFHF